MPSEPPLVLVLELHGVGDAISGRLCSSESGLTTPFVGWLGLAAAIEQAARETRNTSAVRPGVSPEHLP